MLTAIIAVVAYLAVGSGRQYSANRAYHPLVIPSPTAAPAPAASALAALDRSPAPANAATSRIIPSPGGVAGTLAGPLSAAALGPSVAAQVYDASSGLPLLNERGGELVAPASTAKLLTAAAILSVHKGTDRFATRVVAGPDPATVVLIGGGDPTLSGAPAGQPTEYDEAGRISDLAAQVRKVVGAQPISRVLVDDSLFTGPATAPGWAAEDAPSEYASPITALMVDAGRDTPGAAARSGTPDLAAGQALANALGGAEVSAGTAVAGAKVLARVQSAPVSRLVEQMLVESDNVIAEVLARQVALASKQPGSFAAGAAAIAKAVGGLGVAAGAGMRDGSGLSVQDRLPAAALSQVLLLATGPKHPELRPILSGLSVAGWDGTLVEQQRFGDGSSAGQGVVRAKTGSLTGVSALAGVVTDVDGRQLVFAFVADQVPSADPVPSRNAIDVLATALAACGCR
ncbi:MAG: D-alanyl-D-alanine carboxypeptidase/D-alanyl-D-alanine-endopeptidase [Frankiales bacterium]|nr:D-alanyl-D-alanine carboxypeptidase/D-alanyl-D-alanine-endopeptidase [Frankiales bacterium]